MTLNLLLIFACLFCNTFLENEARVFKNNTATVKTNTDTYLTPPKIIRKNGYPAEAHIIQSEDGYLLEYHRIPHGKGRDPSMNKPYPILLHHGLLCSSGDWIVNGPEKSLAYRLADIGFDVWMANARGNTFSRSHISMAPNEKKFWDFTFHEMGVYDLPAAIDYILNTTNREKLVYIGHSLGTTAFYAFAATKLDYNDKILFQISVSPVAGLGHTTSAFRLFAPYATQIESISDWYNKGAFLEHDLLTTWLSRLLCGKDMFNYNICEQLIIFQLFGKDKEQFNESLLPVVYSTIPAGTSGKNMIHCAQMINSGKFCYYDYGLAGNIKKYNKHEPPSYNLSAITVPMRFYYGKNDILACPIDTELLYQKISKPLGLVPIGYEKWNHVDFLWAIDVNKYFNDELLAFVTNATSNPEDIKFFVQDAIGERITNEIPENVPFDETNFSEKFNKQLPEVQTWENNIAIGDKLNASSNMISNSLKRTGKSLRDGIENAAEKVKKTVQSRIADAKNTVTSSIEALERKMNETMNKLTILFRKS